LHITAKLAENSRYPNLLLLRMILQSNLSNELLEQERFQLIHTEEVIWKEVLELSISIKI